jgi:hypothetical protein
MGVATSNTTDSVYITTTNSSTWTDENGVVGENTKIYYSDGSSLAHYTSPLGTDMYFQRITEHNLQHELWTGTVVLPSGETLININADSVSNLTSPTFDYISVSGTAETPEGGSVVISQHHFGSDNQILTITDADGTVRTLDGNGTPIVVDVGQSLPVAHADYMQVDVNSVSNVIDVLVNDEGEDITDLAGIYIRDSVGNNLLDLKNTFAKNYLYENGLSGDGSTTIDGVVWTISTINTETQSITTTTNNQGYTETVTSDTATQDTISTYTTSMGSNSVKTPGTYSTSLTGPLVIDTSGTFAFNANDTRTLTNVSIAYIDGVIADSGFYWIGGTALLDGEPVTVDFKEIRSLQVTAVGIAENGTVAIVDGEIQYTPNTDFSGMDSFAYTITDSATGEISIATVNVEVALTTEPTAPSNNILVQGSDNNDILTIDSGTSIVQAGDGMDLAIFNDSYDNYTFSQSDSFVPYVTHNVTGQVTSLYGVEHIKFTDGLIDLSNVGDGRFMIDSFTYAESTHPDGGC